MTWFSNQQEQGDMKKSTYDSDDNWKIDIDAGWTDLSNLNASSAPTVNDDASAWYSVSSKWIDTNNDNTYVCVDSTTWAAVWVQTNLWGWSLQDAYDNGNTITIANWDNKSVTITNNDTTNNPRNLTLDNTTTWTTIYNLYKTGNSDWILWETTWTIASWKWFFRTFSSASANTNWTHIELKDENSWTTIPLQKFVHWGAGPHYNLNANTNWVTINEWDLVYNWTNLYFKPSWAQVDLLAWWWGGWASYFWEVIIPWTTTASTDIVIATIFDAVTLADWNLSVTWIVTNATIPIIRKNGWSESTIATISPATTDTPNANWIYKYNDTTSQAFSAWDLLIARLTAGQVLDLHFKWSE